jgi:hypothetical protein
MFVPHELEGIEIYRNRLEMPLDLEGLRAPLFWSHSGRPAQGHSWRFIGGAGVALGSQFFSWCSGGAGASRVQRSRRPPHATLSGKWRQVGDVLAGGNCGPMRVDP